MDSAIKKPKTIAELLPGLSGILSKDAMQTLTAKKAPRTTVVYTRTDEKVVKPLTLAEMRSNLQALKTMSPARSNQTTASNKKKWNSSVKVDKKTTSHTAGRQMKHNSVRKVLNFQLPKGKPPKMSMMPNSRITLSSETPKFPKPELKVKKSFHLQAKTNVRISGVYQIPETPVYNKPPKSRMTLANKENVANQAFLNRKTITEHQLTKTNINKKLATPKSALRQRVLISSVIPDTPLSNESWKSSCDASFLQKEKEIDFIEEQTNALLQEQTLEDIAEISPPVSTPFKDYRNVTEFFNNSSVNDSSNACQDNTIMTFDPPNNCKQNGKREESVIVSLCELLNKATVSTEQTSTELDDLLKFEQQTENNIKTIENTIRLMEKVKESEIKSLQYVRKLIKEKRERETRISESEKDKTVIEITKDSKEQIPKPCLVIKSIKSPSYKIPKKNTCLRKKVFHKSMPNVSYLSPQKDMGDRAFNMYMQMKERMQFLSTPLVKQRTEVPDTPAITSHNLQKQLDKLYTES